MKVISIYNNEAERIEKLCEKYDTLPADIIEALLDAVDDEIIDLKDYGFTE